MCKFYVVSGRVTEAHRFINVPLRWAEEFPARERREFWVATAEGQEVKLVVHSRQMPARVGHQVDVLLLDGQVVGLRNLTTGAEVNFMRVDPPLIWRRSDSLLMAVILLASFVALLLGRSLHRLLVWSYSLSFPCCYCCEDARRVFGRGGRWMQRWKRSPPVGESCGSCVGSSEIHQGWAGAARSGILCARRHDDTEHVGQARPERRTRPTPPTRPPCRKSQRGCLTSSSRGR